MSETFRLHGKVHLDILSSALSRLAERHEMLRSRFLDVGGLPEQVILKTPRPPLLRVLDFTGHRPAAALCRAHSRIRAIASTPFNLQRDPLFFCEFIRLADDEGLLSFHMHHIISDGWSARMICDDVSEFYNAHIAGRAARLPDLAIDYVDFAEWEQATLEAPAMIAHQEYWLDQLAGVPTRLDLPCDEDVARTGPTRSGPARAGPALAETMLIPECRASSLSQAAERFRVTPFVLLFAAFQVALAAWTGQRDFVIGVPAAGRGRLELQNVVGLFVNMLALRSCLRDDPTFQVLVQRAGAASGRAFEHQDFPFQRLVELLNPLREPGGNPLVQASFQLIDRRVAGRLALSGVDSRRENVPTGQAPFDLEVEVTAGSEFLDCQLRYRSPRLSAQAVALLGRLFRTVLAEGLVDPGRRVSEYGRQAASGPG
jgi:Condensation domain